MATNIFGIFESLIVRKQIKQEKERREREGPPPKKPGMLSRLMKHVAEQAEELQRQADSVSGRQASGRRPKAETRQK
jgi:hypothetical protein